MKKIVFFCSASDQCPKEYNENAAKVVEALCEKGYGIVSGGTVLGTMGVISNTVAKCGGYHKGVLPSFMQGLDFPGLSEVVWTDTMSERKERMREGTCAAIALPGGTGTLDELIETYVLRRLARYPGMVIALNIDGFYEPFKALLGHYAQTGMMPAEDLAMIHFPSTVEELAALFK